MDDEAPPDGNDEGMAHTELSIARPDPVRYPEWMLRDNTARMRWLRQAVRGAVQISPLALRWQDRRDARRREHWKRNMHRDQWLGIW
jgi:hypothetical protein